MKEKELVFKLQKLLLTKFWGTIPYMNDGPNANYEILVQQYFTKICYCVELIQYNEETNWFWKYNQI